MINPKQLRSIVEQTLKSIDLYSPDATNLILGTIAQESNFGTFIKQIKGPALGICQMEPNTFNDIVENYLNYRHPLKIKILVETNTQRLEPQALESNLSLSIAMCRIHYLRQPEPIPSNIEGYAQYWKQHYNTHLGKGTEEQFIKNYISHIHLQHTH